ncbi:MAG TPA: sigma-54 dependent transcriptional regulator [Candidatus Krumholzibacteria bacterium]|nr:sigma-54 dependent transcriptional regulator [Candidatus Krumholzibacteria bacterium]HPD72398.1 sigma-54 dependent transcriptional regulator [Candidatus Krumholzibacteria bacterium]HRY40670.1 sigma-54 dependent transcriptional regulator [Candidatus Krumholzibacteria bacterium]
MTRVLLIDDDRNLREVVGFILREAGYAVSDAGSAEEGLVLFERQGADLVLTDMKMPGRDGLDVLRAVQPSGTPVIVLTAHGTVAQAVEAMRLGASSYLLKPFERAELLVTVAKALGEGALRRENQNLRDLLQRRQGESGLVYRSAAMAHLIEQARQVAASEAPVLITGESGTGKELIARLVHDASPRWDGPFVAVNCGAIPDDLAPSELFGHVRGAFTGAEREHTGRIRAAAGGTLLLDEIGELPLALQPKLLRALETRQVDPVGAVAPVDVDFRLVCSTNRDLVAAGRDGRFREDLYYRIAIVVLHVPPLRERREDVAPLWEHFTRLHGDERVASTPRLVAALAERPWPGNVRQLRNLNQRLVVLRSGDRLDLADLARAEAAAGNAPATGAAGSPLVGELPPDRLDLGALEEEIIRRTLERFGGNKTRTAEYLGIPRHVLVYRLKKFDA